jgi:hypothetical protein
MFVAPWVVLLIAQAGADTAGADARAKAQTLLKEGARLYEQGALVPALEKFNQAYEEFPSPKLLFNIGQASRDLGHAVEAMDAFERFLAEATDAPDDRINEAKTSVATLEGKLGKLKIECEVPGADIGLDGKLIGKSPLPRLVWAQPGRHQVTAEKRGFLPAIEDVEVKASWVHTVVMSPQPVEAPPAAPPPRPRAAAVDRPPQRPQLEVETPSPPAAALASSYRWAYVATGAAVAFAGTATVLGLSMRAKFDSLNQSCGSESGSATGCSDSQIDGVLLRRDLANVSWGLAAAAAVTAGVLFIVEGRAVTVAPMGGEATGVVAQMAY